MKNQNAYKKVVITGMGVVSPIGAGKNDFWRELIAGRSGISEVERFDTSEFPAHRAGEVKNFTPERFMDASFAAGIGRTSQLAVSAAKLALDDAGFDRGSLVSRRAGVAVGTTMGEIPSMEMIDKYWTKNGEDDVFVSNILKYPTDNISSNLARYFGLSMNTCLIPTACAAGNYSIGFAFDMIRTGRADIMLAGGADSLSKIAYTGFNRLFAMSSDHCRPFDANRKGMILGEGSGIVVLEELESALERGATIYSEVLGYGLSCDAHHMTAPNVDGVSKVMERAIVNSGIKKEAVGYISAHGTGTPMNDKTECEAIKRVFGDLVPGFFVSSIKSMLGHTMGAASAIEAIACCLAITNGTIPPTMNYETPDEACAVNCAPNKALKMKVEVALNNSFAFGGNNACVVFKGYKG
jgi:3-oxoacyl-[acyl-carrier-protein] synthase II